MLSKITIRRFKKFEEISFALTSPVVLIGPNNAGKTSLLQAITLLDAGLTKWLSQNAGNGSRKKRTGVVINRKDLTSIPVPHAKLLWYGLHVRTVERVGAEKKQKTSNINIEIEAEGWNHDKKWLCAFEFDFANDETFYCRPLRKDAKGEDRHDINLSVADFKVAYLQPMSGLSMQEDLLNEGSINRLIGEGKTADVIRNICYQLTQPVKKLDADSQKSATKENQLKDYWIELKSLIQNKFRADIQEPTYDPNTGLLEMRYKEKGIEYDISSSGRGMQQTLLLLAFIFANANKLILMDEPDAHLEVIRQRETYNLIREIAQKANAQLIIASHSEVVLNEAAQKDCLIAILQDKAIPINNPQQRSQFRKALTDLGWEKYYLAKLKGHCLYLEGATDLDNLMAFATLIHHDVVEYLPNANIDFIENNVPKEAFNRFKGLQMAEPALRGLAIFDRISNILDADDALKVICWKKRELENYFCLPFVLMRWAEAQSTEETGQTNMFRQHWRHTMETTINDLTAPIYLKEPNHDWWNNEKLGDWAENIFREFYSRLQLPMDMRKGRFHELVRFLEPKEVPKEVRDKLDEILNLLKPGLE